MLLAQRIKEIKTQVRHPDRRTIIFDDGTFIGISEEVLLSNPVHPGDELTPNKLKQLTNSEQKQKLRNSALNLLSFRMRSLSELKQRLLKKGYDVQDIEPLLEEFDAKNILNDSEFALAFSRDKIRSKGIGPSILRVELSNHHLPQNLVEDTVNRMYTEFPIDTLLGNHLKKKKICRNSQLQEREKSRIVNFLKRKGFSWDDISRVFVDKQIT
jgi:regulatory protein